MSKNAEGWIRHNNKKQPVDDHVEVEIRARGGDYEVCKAYGFALDATGEYQIMAYRLHKPAEQPINMQAVAECADAFGDSHADVMESVLSRLDGPLQWRDRIAEIDVDIKFEEDRYNANMACMNQERAELVQKLASEGFALIGRVVEPVEDMSDWRNWKAGDYLKVINAGTPYFAFDDIVKVTKVFNSAVGAGECESIDGGIEGFWNTFDMKFHSRPSA